MPVWDDISADGGIIGNAEAYDYIMAENIEKPKLISVGRMPAFGALFYLCGKDVLLLVPNPGPDRQERTGSLSPVKDPALKLMASRIGVVLLASAIFLFGVYRRQAMEMEETYWLFCFMPVACGFMTGVAAMEYISEKLMRINFREVGSLDPSVAAAIRKKLWKDIIWTCILTVLALDTCGLLTVWFYPFEAYKEFMPPDLFTYLTFYGCTLILYLAWSLSPVHWKYKAILKIRALTVSDEEIAREEEKLEEQHKEKDGN